jgi:hypothetical protein
LFVVTVWLWVEVLGDAVLPPVSSKVLKFIVEAGGGRLGGVVAGRVGYKPVFVSMLYRGFRPLYSTGDRVASVGAGVVLAGRVSVLSGDDRVLVEVGGLEGVWGTPYGRFRVWIDRVEAVSLDSLSLPSPAGGPTGVLRVEARTPVVVTSKTLLASDASAARRIPQLYRLLPSPGLIAAQSFRLWNRVVPPEYRFVFVDGWNRDAYMVSRAAEIYMAELDYNIKPETVVVGRDQRGRLRRVRGWKGWIV